MPCAIYFIHFSNYVHTYMKNIIGKAFSNIYGLRQCRRPPEFSLLFLFSHFGVSWAPPVLRGVPFWDLPPFGTCRLLLGPGAPNHAENIVIYGVFRGRGGGVRFGTCLLLGLGAPNHAENIVIYSVFFPRGSNILLHPLTSSSGLFRPLPSDLGVKGA